MPRRPRTERSFARELCQTLAATRDERNGPPCGPPRSPVRKTQAIRQPPGMAHEHTASTADGTTIAWSRSGSGGPVVLVRGITESAGSWDPVTDRLATTNDVITPDLRVHGKSGTADAYDPAAMVSAIAAVNAATDVATPHLVGHVLGGAVVSAAGPALRPTSVASIGQSLQLGEFKAQIVAAEPILRDPDNDGLAVDAMFEAMSGELICGNETARVNALRNARQDVLLGVWGLAVDRTPRGGRSNGGRGAARPSRRCAALSRVVRHRSRRRLYRLARRVHHDRLRTVGRRRPLPAPRRSRPLRCVTPPVLGGFDMSDSRCQAPTVAQPSVIRTATS